MPASRRRDRLGRWSGAWRLSTGHAVFRAFRAWAWRPRGAWVVALSGAIWQIRDGHAKGFILNGQSIKTQEMPADAHRACRFLPNPCRVEPTSDRRVSATLVERGVRSITRAVHE